MIDTSEIGSEVFIGIEAKGLSSRYLSSVYTSDLRSPVCLNPSFYSNLLLTDSEL